MLKPDIRWIQRLRSFQKALKSLSNAVDLSKTRELSILEQQGLIQAFEFTHELAWNALKDLLQSRGTAASMLGSKDATREAFAKGLLDDGQAWMDMIRHRNLSTHTYNESVLKEVAEAILSTNFEQFLKLQTRLLQLEAEEASQ